MKKLRQQIKILFVLGIIVSSFLAGFNIILDNRNEYKLSNAKSFEEFISIECVIVRKGEQCIEHSADGICCVKKRKK